MTSKYQNQQQLNQSLLNSVANGNTFAWMKDKEREEDMLEICDICGKKVGICKCLEDDDNEKEDEDDE